MKTKYQYIDFVKVPFLGKTDKWDCQTVNGGNSLGVVKWHGAWRQYCYFPACQAVYSAGCLSDIADFMKQFFQPGEAGL